MIEGSSLRLFHLVDEAFAISFFAKLFAAQRLAPLFRLILGSPEKLLNSLIQNFLLGALPRSCGRCFSHIALLYQHGPKRQFSAFRAAPTKERR